MYLLLNISQPIDPSSVHREARVAALRAANGPPSSLEDALPVLGDQAVLSYPLFHDNASYAAGRLIIMWPVWWAWHPDRPARTDMSLSHGVGDRSHVWTLATVTIDAVRGIATVYQHNPREHLIYMVVNLTSLDIHFP